MTRDEILRVLKGGSDRWNTNRQPDLETAAEALWILNVVEMRMTSNDTLLVKFGWPVPQEKAFDAVSSLRPDEFRSVSDWYRLWWD
jgi:hypothetical protein